MVKQNEVTIEMENLIMAHCNGCDDVKQTLEHLFPDAFKGRPKPGQIWRYIPTNNLWLILANNKAVMISRGGNIKDAAYTVAPIFFDERYELLPNTYIEVHDESK